MFKKKGFEKIENKSQEQQPKISWSDFEISLNDNENNLEFYNKNEKLLRQRLLEVQRVFSDIDIKLDDLLEFPNQLKDLETYKKYYFNLKKGETILEIEHSLQIEYGLLDKDVLKSLALLMLDNIKEIENIDSEKKGFLKKMSLLMILKYDLLDQKNQETFKNNVQDLEFTKSKKDKVDDEVGVNEDKKQILSSESWDSLYKNISEVFNNDDYESLTINIIRAIDINDEAITIENIPQENGLKEKVIELFKNKELSKINNFADWKKTLFAFVDSVDAFVIIEELVDWEFSDLNKSFTEDKYGLLNKAKELYLKNQEDFDDFIKALDRNKNKVISKKKDSSGNQTWGNGSEDDDTTEEKIKVAKDILIQPDNVGFNPSTEVLPREDREKREKLVKNFESAVMVYKKNFDNLKKIINETEQEINEIKNQYINSKLLFENQEYTEKYSDKMSKLVDLNLNIRNYYQEYNKLEVLLEKYKERYRILLNNKNLGYPIEEEEKQWLKEVQAKNFKENIFSWVRNGEVGFILALNEDNNINIFFDNEDYLLSENGRIMEKILKNGKDVEQIENRDQRLISNEWMGIYNLLNQVDFVSQYRKENFIESIKEKKKGIDYKMKRKYNLDLPVNVAGIEVSFSNKQAVIDHELINYIDKEIQDFSVDLEMAERNALTEVLLYKRVLEGNEISYEKIKFIKNRLNKLLINYNVVKTLLENKLDDYPYLKLLPNKLFTLDKKENIKEVIAKHKLKDESLLEFLLAYDSRIKKENQKLERENLIEDKELFNEFVNYIKFSVDLGAWRYGWDEEVVDDYQRFIEKHVKPLLSKQKNIHSRIEAIQFLKRYTESLPKNAPLLEGYEYLVDVILDPFV